MNYYYYYFTGLARDNMIALVAEGLWLLRYDS